MTTALDLAGRCRPLLLADFQSLAQHAAGTPLTVEYCDIVAGDWIDQFVHVCIAALAEPRFVAAGSEDAIPTFAVPEQFKHAASFDEGLFAALRFVLTSPANARHGIRVKQPELNVDAAASSIRSRVRSRSIGRRTSPVLICSPYYRCSRSAWLRGLWRLRKVARWDNLSAVPVFRPAFDLGRRLLASERVEGGGTTHAIRSAMPLFLPTVFFENLADARASVRALAVPRPRLAYTAQGVHANLTFKLLTADWREEGTRLVVHQHGGGYGIDRRHTPEDYEIGIAHRFYSWGWRRLDDARVVPLSSTPPARHASRERRGILLCCVDYPRLPYRIHYQPMGAAIEVMHAQTFDFLGRLALEQDLTVRPYPQEWGWGFAAKLRNAGGRASFDTSPGPPYRAYAACAIAVHNYLGTGWLETLSQDVPTVCFFDPGIHAFRPEAGLLIDALERVGIVHRSGSDAAEFVNRIAHDPGGWWNGADVRQARAAFVARYANFSETWADEWALEFEERLESAS